MSPGGEHTAELLAGVSNPSTAQPLKKSRTACAGVGRVCAGCRAHPEEHLVVRLFLRFSARLRDYPQTFAIFCGISVTFRTLRWRSQRTLHNCPRNLRKLSLSSEAQCALHGRDRAQSSSWCSVASSCIKSATVLPCISLRRQSRLLQVLMQCHKKWSA